MNKRIYCDAGPKKNLQWTIEVSANDFSKYVKDNQDFHTILLKNNTYIWRGFLCAQWRISLGWTRSNFFLLAIYIYIYCDFNYQTFFKKKKKEGREAGCFPSLYFLFYSWKDWQSDRSGSQSRTRLEWTQSKENLFLLFKRTKVSQLKGKS